MAASLSNVARLLLACGLAFGGLLVGAWPADALIAWGIESPAPGTRLGAPETVTVVAFVDHASAEEVQRMEVRFTRGGQPAGVVRRLDLIETRELHAGMSRSRFAAQFDPMSASWFEFRPAPNGHYQLHARVQYAVQGANQEASSWSSGSGFVVDVPPPRTTADASLLDAEARTVAVSWQPVGAGLPDFRRYIVERAATGGAWRVVEEATDPSAAQFDDTVPAEGEYRYRVTVQRAGADGDRSSQPADTRAVQVRSDPAPEPGPGTGGGGASPPAGGEGGEGPGEGPGGDGSPGDGAEAGEGGASGDGAGGGASGARSGSSWRPWMFPGRPPSSAPQQPDAERPRAAPPPQDSTFQEYLDYGDGEWEVTERRLVREAPRAGVGSTLTVFNQELALEQVLVPVAGGLVLIMLGAHVVRFLNP